MSVIGANIKKYRSRKGLTQEQLGQQLGVTTQAVSKWECGGTPDAELLPRISQLLGVSIDALFGREEQTIAVTLMRRLGEMPEKEAYRFAFEICWAIQIGMVRDKQLVDDFLNIFVDRSTICTDKAAYYSKIMSDEGLTKTRMSPGFDYFFLMPEPENLAQRLAPAERLRQVFEVMADKQVMQIVYYLYSRLNTPIATSLISKNTGNPPRDVDECMERLCVHNLASKSVVATSDGEIYSYMFHSESAVVPLLCFADEITQTDARDFLMGFFRTKPIFSTKG